MSARDMFRDMGIPLPPPIKVKPVTRPFYNNTAVLSFGRWREMNLQALTDYWNALASSEQVEILGEEDFHIFTVIQHERELDRRDEMRRAYGSSGGW